MTFYGLPNYSIHCLQKFQNTAACIVTRSVRASHITPILESVHWLPVDYCINFMIYGINRCSLSLHKSHYLSSLFSLRSNFYSVRSSSFSPLLLPYFSKKSHSFRSFSYAALHLWNRLPTNVCTALTCMSFRKIPKTDLFN